MNYKYAMVVVGYNRPDSVLRLLKSLDNVKFGNANVDLIVSIDNSGNDAVENVSREFEWKYGQKKVFTYLERMGLRKHILHCGAFLEEYDAIAVLEDDLIVSPALFHYMQAAVEKYYDNENIAGISLYTHLWNPNGGYPFAPDSNGHDVFFMQMAQSWGQVWMRNQWKDFMEWYKENDGEIEKTWDFPEYITKWSKSWLKYHIKYCSENKKYFVYPYLSYTTCFNEAGEHSVIDASVFQVPMMRYPLERYRFPELDDVNAVRYDVFFEREKLGRYLDASDDELTVDIYGTKVEATNQRKYLLSSRKLKYKVMKKYALQMRPQECNIMYDIAGKDIFLYDTLIKADSSAETKGHNERSYIYYHRIHGNTRTIGKVLLYKVKECIYIAIERYIKKVKKK